MSFQGVFTASGSTGCDSGPTPITTGPGEVDAQPAPFGPSFSLGTDPTHLVGSLSGTDPGSGTVERHWKFTWNLRIVNSPDSDSDGLSDYLEKAKYGTDPRNADTDGDGYTDGEEVAAGTDPLNPKSHPNN